MLIIWNSLLFFVQFQHINKLINYTFIRFVVMLLFVNLTESKD